MKYLLVFEDGNIRQCEKITDEDIQSVKDGILDIIKVEHYKTDYEAMGRDGNWEKVEDMK